MSFVAGGRQVEVRSPAGEACLDTEPALQRLVAETPPPPAGATHAACDAFGAALFQAVFQREVGERLAASLERTAARGHGLRLVCSFSDDTSRLAALPWELLFDPRGNRRFAMDPRTPFTRTLAVAQGRRALAAEGAPRMLVVCAAPPEAELVDVEGEARHLMALADGAGVRAKCLRRATRDALADELRTNAYDVVHFAVHGGFLAEGRILLDIGAEGGPAPVDRDLLETLFGDQAGVRLVVLNCCASAQGASGSAFRGLAQALLRQNVPAVVGMQFNVGDESATRFAAAFYQEVFAGREVDLAVNIARHAVYLADQATPDCGAPVLYLRAAAGLTLVPPNSRNDRASDAGPGCALGQHLARRWAGDTVSSALEAALALVATSVAGTTAIGILVRATLECWSPDWHLDRREVLAALACLTGLPVLGGLGWASVGALARRGMPTLLGAALAAGAAGLTVFAWLRSLGQ